MFDTNQATVSRFIEEMWSSFLLIAERIRCGGAKHNQSLTGRFDNIDAAAIISSVRKAASSFKNCCGYFLPLAIFVSYFIVFRN